MQYDGVGVMCSKLLTIDFIDVAEEALTGLSKLAHEHGYGHADHESGLTSSNL